MHSEQYLIFWIAVGLQVYTWVGYPLLAGLLALLLGRRKRRKSAIEPRVSVLAVAGNDEAGVRESISALLALDYPGELLELVLAVNGATDHTAAIARARGGARVRVVKYAREGDRSTLLNDLVPQLRGDVVLVSDARQTLDPGALRAIVANFADPRTAVVSGRLQGDAGAGRWTEWYETCLRRWESATGALVAVEPRMYAFRRRLFRPLCGRTQSVEVLIPLSMARGRHRIVFEPEARSRDRSESQARDFRRRVRSSSRNVQLLLQEPWLLNPFANRLWLQTLSHRFCRLAGPLCLAAAFVSNLYLYEPAAFRILLSLQILFYSAAIAGGLRAGAAHQSALFAFPYAFCRANWATALGIFNFLLRGPRPSLEKVQN